MNRLARLEQLLLPRFPAAAGGSQTMHHRGAGKTHYRLHITDAGLASFVSEKAKVR
ncbi:MAG: hypothetical protein ACOY5B_01570 [Spirochaetota bacterium]